MINISADINTNTAGITRDCFGNELQETVEAVTQLTPTIKKLSAISQRAQELAQHPHLEAAPASLRSEIERKAQAWKNMSVFLHEAMKEHEEHHFVFLSTNDRVKNWQNAKAWLQDTNKNVQELANHDIIRPRPKDDSRRQRRREKRQQQMQEPHHHQEQPDQIVDNKDLPINFADPINYAYL